MVTGNSFGSLSQKNPDKANVDDSSSLSGHIKVSDSQGFEHLDFLYRRLFCRNQIIASSLIILENLESIFPGNHYCLEVTLEPVT